MAQMTLEQQKAIAVARARLRLQQQQATTAKPAMPTAPSRDEAQHLPAFPTFIRNPLSGLPMMDPTKPSIMSEMAAEVVRGVPEAITSIPKIPGALWNLVKQSPYLGGRPDPEMLSAAASPVTTPAKQAIELIRPGMVNAPTPESLESRQAARTAGTLLASAELPNLAGGAARVLKPIVKPAVTAIKQSVVNAPIVNRWMGVSPKWLEHGANPGQQLLESKLLGATKDATLRNVKRNLDALGPRMDVKFASVAGKTIDASDDVINSLNAGVRDLSAGSDAAFRARLNNILETITTEFPDIARLTPARARVLKTRIYDAMYFSGAAEESPINTVLSRMSGGINSKIKAAVPGIAEDFREWGNLYQARRALEAGIARDLAGVGTGSMRGVAVKRIAKGAAEIGAPIAGAAIIKEMVK